MIDYCPHGAWPAQCPECIEAAQGLVAAVVEPLDELLDELERVMIATVDEYKDANIGVLLPAVLLDAIEARRRKLQGFEGFLIPKIADAFRDEPQRLPSGRTLVIQSSRARRAWQHEQIRSAWMTKVYEAMVDKATGEEPSPQEYAARILEGPQIGSWKVKPLKEVGIAVDDYCSHTWGIPQATFGE